MDILTLIGICIGIGAILGGNLLEGGHLGSLFQPTAFIIVMGGTLGAVAIQTQKHIFIGSFKALIWVFIPPKTSGHSIIEKIVNWSQIARKEGLLALEALVESETEKFSAKGLQLLVDGSEPEIIRQILEVEMATQEHQYTQMAKVFEGMGGYSPTIGIIGAVMGLIHVMENLSDPSKLGSGIAVAFVATIYGVGLANILFLPFANKLKQVAHDQLLNYEMIIEGVVSISQGENPRSIESKLQGYLH
ncbi:MAG: flagellar motor protein [Gammaproteobacteria bacterium]|jgi:chemotaxis protein MotA|nr:MAG: flagellar motor protein [Gammaproteobacteria bacterium]